MIKPTPHYVIYICSMIEDKLLLKKLYNNLINDEDFDRLELGLNQPNIFEILKISKTEIRHSNFLSWLINPKGSHGLGEIFLKKFLREVFSSEKSTNIDQIEVNKIDYSNVEIIREWKNIDLLIIARVIGTEMVTVFELSKRPITILFNYLG